MDDSHLPFAIGGMLLFAAILLVLVLIFARRIMGWSRLEELFPDRPNDPVISRYHLQSLFVAKPGRPLPGPYIQGFVSLIACKSGLRISVWPGLALVFKPIFLRWDAITSVAVTMRVTGIKACGLQAGPDDPFTLTIIARVARKISTATNGALSIPSELQ
ncbi:hypothetical protein [Erythrobacter sp.]|jgi:hypothetical protein|uniref:hypothetical protein n=1 Tax=Erythrobacter sp. TaxID=1042 RepID=UPI002E9B0F04|nr:hypothetical protein [Erythrobacter sp.]